jgi:NADH-quinone oxidoreductase subunit C
MNFADAVATLEGKFQILHKTEFRGETTLEVAPETIHAIAACCKEELGFNYLIDLSGVDNFGEEPRFEVVYELCILETNEHLRLKCAVSEDALEVATVSDLWATANWHEREAFDMFGIRFADHPNLTRILMWEGFPYHPLRKDFPLAGRETSVPDVAFTNPIPLAGGPFVTSAGAVGAEDREPRARPVD